MQEPCNRMHQMYMCFDELYSRGAILASALAYNK